MKVGMTSHGFAGDSRREKQDELLASFLYLDDAGTGFPIFDDHDEDRMELPLLPKKNLYIRVEKRKWS